MDQGILSIHKVVFIILGRHCICTLTVFLSGNSYHHCTESNWHLQPFQSSPIEYLLGVIGHRVLYPVHFHSDMVAEFLLGA